MYTNIGREYQCGLCNVHVSSFDLFAKLKHITIYMHMNLSTRMSDTVYLLLSFFTEKLVKSFECDACQASFS